MFEKPILNLVKFNLADVLTASGETPTETPTDPSEDDCPAYCATHVCPNDTSEMG